MQFKEVEFSKVPAFDHFKSRLGLLRPTFTPVKVGREFDADIYRIYVQESNAPRLPVDIDEYLLQNLEQNSHSSESTYSRELLAKLDNLIETAIHRLN
jgi:hypothetical protein